MCAGVMAGIGGVFPPAFISSLSNALVMISLPNLIVQKVCSPLSQPSINDFICSDKDLVAEATNILNLPFEPNLIDILDGITVAKSTIRSVLSAVSSPLFGYWRDTTGHNKRLLYIGEAAEAVSVLFCLFAAWHWSGTPWIPAILESVVGGLFGMEVFRLGLNCMVIEGSKPEERTMRLQLFTASTLIGFLLAMVIRGFWLTAVGYTTYFFAVSCLHLVAILLIKTSVKDVRKSIVKMERMDFATKLKTVFKPRANRSVIWLMLISKPLYMTFFSAERTIEPYYLQQAFQFTVKEETFRGSYCMVINLLASLAMPLLLIRYLKWSDFKIGIISLLMAVVTALSMAFAASRTTLYIIPFLDILRFNLFSIPQSILSKCIRSDELGLLEGFSSILAIFLPFGVNYLYKSTFSATSQTMPGAIYLISALGNTIIMVLFCISSYLYIQPSKSKKEENDKSESKKTD